MFRISFFVICCCFALNASSQSVHLLTSGNKTSLRGLSVVNDKVLWVSGSNGSVGRSVDGGTTWQWHTVKGFEKRDFRDIEAFDDKTAIIIAIAEPGQILKTTDGGTSWKIVYTDSTKDMFLDAMDFSDAKNGIAIGDPLDKECIYVVTTTDGGETWSKQDCNKLPAVQEGEAMFASSGTNVVYVNKKKINIITGGMASSLLTVDKDSAQPLPIIQGKESTGANSLAIFAPNNMIVTGGDFAHDKDTTQNCVLSHDGGATWVRPATPPHGYRSCVEYITANHVITCGTSGVDISTDGGMNWKQIAQEGFHVCQKAKKGTAVYLAGGNGKIAKLVW
ncbi:MAG: oxidoreductase [Chitinophagaceae bacterium]